MLIAMEMLKLEKMYKMTYLYMQEKDQTMFNV